MQSCFYNAGSSSCALSCESKVGSLFISPLITFVSKSQTLTNETLWALQNVKHKYSANSFDKV